MTTTLRGNRPFQRFWWGQSISQLGDRVSELALPLIAVTLLGVSAAQIGLLTALIWLPSVGAVALGAWVDRRPDRRRLLIVADLGRAAVLLTVPLAYLAGVLTFVQLCVVGLLTGAGQLLFQMAYQAFYVSLVPPESYVEANSRLSVSRGASFVVGPAVGGVLVQLLTAPVAVLADVFSFLGSALLLRRIRTVEAPPADPGPSIWSQMHRGVVDLLRHPIMRATLFACAGTNFFGYIATALMILYAGRELALTPGAIGVAFGLGAVGAVAGAVVTPRVSRWLGAGPTAILGGVIFPLPLAAMALAHGGTVEKVAWLAGAEFVSSIGVMLFDINLNALLTQVTPDDARGRRAGAFTAVNYGMRPLGALAGGGIGTLIGVRASLVLAGLAGTATVLFLVASPVRHIRRIEDLGPAVPPPRSARRPPHQSTVDSPAASADSSAAATVPSGGSGVGNADRST